MSGRQQLGYQPPTDVPGHPGDEGETAVPDRETVQRDGAVGAGLAFGDVTSVSRGDLRSARRSRAIRGRLLRRRQGLAELAHVLGAAGGLHQLAVLLAVRLELSLQVGAARRPERRRRLLLRVLVLLLLLSEDGVGVGDGPGLTDRTGADRPGAEGLAGEALDVADGTGAAGADVAGPPVTVGVRAFSVEGPADGVPLGSRPAGGGEIFAGGADVGGGVSAGVVVRLIVPVTAAAVPSRPAPPPHRPGRSVRAGAGAPAQAAGRRGR